MCKVSIFSRASNGWIKLRRERTVHAESREEAIRLWQAFRDEISGKPPASEPPAQPRVITFGAFVTEYPGQDLRPASKEDRGDSR